MGRMQGIKHLSGEGDLKGLGFYSTLKKEICTSYGDK